MCVCSSICNIFNVYIQRYPVIVVIGLLRGLCEALTIDVLTYNVTSSANTDIPQTMSHSGPTVLFYLRVDYFIDFNRKVANYLWNIFAPSAYMSIASMLY